LAFYGYEYRQILPSQTEKGDLYYYPQTEENVKKEMEEWSKQADETKSEG